jgi:sterol desaturase/sphingolipid hydroxylase (fatty acid hydroxylase superfamily)
MNTLLNWPPMVFNVAFIVAASVLALVFFRAEGAPGSWRGLWDLILPPEARRSRSLRVDAFFYLAPKLFLFKLSVLVNVASAAFLHGYVTQAMTFAFGEPLRRTPGLLILVLLGGVAYLVRDLTLFLSHMVQHRVPILWEFHKVHHSATHLTPLTSVRFHPVEVKADLILDALTFSLILGVAAYFFALDTTATIALAANILFVVNVIILAPLQHSNLPVSFGWFDRLVISPATHRLHHSSQPEHFNKNFGSGLALWDRMFGTLMIPAGESFELGIGSAEQPYYDGAWVNFIRPFVMAYRILRRRAAPAPPPLRTRRPAGRPMKVDGTR